MPSEVEVSELETVDELNPERQSRDLKEEAEKFNESRVQFISVF